MKMKRHTAINMFRSLGAMALGHLDADTLDAVMDNFNAFRKVAEDFERMREELIKRLYADVEEEKKKGFFDCITKMEQAKTADDKELYQNIAKTSYADVWPIYIKHVEVINKLINKDIDVEFADVDADAFIKGIVKGKKDAPIHEIRAVFAPMFKAENKGKDDFSELEDLLK